MADVDMGSPEAASVTGTDLTVHTPASGADDTTFTNLNGNAKLIVINGSGGTLTFDAITEFTAETTLDLEDRSYSFPDGDHRYLQFDETFYNDPDTNKVTLNNFSTTSGVTILCIK